LGIVGLTLSGHDPEQKENLMSIERIRVLVLALLVVMVIVGCDDELESGANIAIPAPAPASVAGLTYDATITSGSGLFFRTSGLFRFEFDTNTYVVYGNAITNRGVTPPSNRITGTYTYTVSADGLVGTVVTTNDDVAPRVETYVFNYVGSTFHGTFSLTTTFDGNPLDGGQAGDIVERPR
jgi:hypothetical protein